MATTGSSNPLVGFVALAGGLSLLTMLGLPSCGSLDTESRAAASLVIRGARVAEITSFAVEVRRVTLHRTEGPATELLGQPVTVDLARSHRVLVAGIELTPGSYERVTAEVDFTTAKAVIEHNADPATVTDPDGRRLGKVRLDIRLVAGAALRFVRHHNHTVALELDLSQARVEATDNTIALLPVAAAALHPPALHEVTTCGRIATVEPSRRELECIRGEDPDDRFVVRIDANTRFLLDGRPARGSNGLAALAAHTAHTAHAAHRSQSPLTVTGMLRPFGREIAAHTVTLGPPAPDRDPGSATTRLACDSMPIDAIAAHGDRLSIDVAAAVAAVLDDGTGRRPLQGSLPPAIMASARPGTFRIVEDREVTVFADFPRFLRSLHSRLSSAAGIARVSAEGTCDSTLLFSADSVTVALH